MGSGRLAGIARHHEPKGAIETIPAASVTTAEGLRGDFRGALASTKAGRARQVSLIEHDGWEAAVAEVHCPLEWWHSRRNLLVSGLRLPRGPGTNVRIGATLVIEITGECSPCERMEALHAGLRSALKPDWRAGFLGRVIADGKIAVGDAIRIVA